MMISGVQVNGFFIVEDVNQIGSFKIINVYTLTMPKNQSNVEIFQVVVEILKKTFVKTVLPLIVPTVLRILLIVSLVQIKTITV